ncbi:MAG: metal ABC transporter solute-binding protein, Zn/Mn family [Solirubrobacterales bacterium]
MRCLTVMLLLWAVLLTGCNSASPGDGRAANGRIQVVAAENFWGSIATQLGGDRVQVRSIIVNPSTDPHSYQPAAQDARAVAGASLAIVNGLGYDKWMAQLLSASPMSGRVVLDVGQLVGLKDGDNPHQWYAPASVYKVTGQIVSAYDKLDPSDAAYFAQQKQTFETQGLAHYNELRKEIRSKYAGTPIGYSESIFRPLGEDLGLELLTPYSFAKAVAEGTDVTAQDKQAVDEQAEHRKIKVWVFNSQNVTPDVQRVNEIAKAKGIPIATVTETLSPASDTFEQWQVGEMEGLMRALHEATGR